MGLKLIKGKVDNLLVMGKSGAGKQPRIDVLMEEFGLKQLSTGDIFRSYLKSFDEIAYPGDIMDFFNPETGTFISDKEIEERLSDYITDQKPEDVILGLKAKYYVSNGLFVPDSVTNSLFLSSFKKNDYRGLVLDGYPRTVEQAEFLVSTVKKVKRKIDAIIHVVNDDETILNRVTGRRVCPNCHKVFHVKYKPLRDGKYCTACGTEAITRIDDTREKVLSRLSEYREKTQDAIQYLISAGVPYIAVPGNLPVLSDEAVRESVLEALENPDGFRFTPEPR